MPKRGRVENLQPWPKGTSGNPHGRPPQAQLITNELRKLVQQSVTVMEFELLEKRTYGEAVAKRLLDLAVFGPPRVAVTAIVEVLDRVEKRPAERSGEKKQPNLKPAR